jgi:hypothetical protein
MPSPITAAHNGEKQCRLPGHKNNEKLDQKRSSTDDFNKSDNEPRDKPRSKDSQHCHKQAHRDRDSHCGRRNLDGDQRGSKE